jgi:enoyl-CoA hydratase/carnithine racemase
VADERAGKYRGGRVALAIHNLPKPVLAAIHSHAVGVGLTMTLPCALRFCSSTAKLALPFARRGIVAEACSSYFLPRLVGRARAMQMVTGGAAFGARDECASGLFVEVLEREEDVLPRTVEAAEEVAREVSVVSWALMRDMFWRGPATPEEAHLVESRALAGLFGGRDNVEGVRSFLEKRAPRFEGTVEEDAAWWKGGSKL